MPNKDNNGVNLLTRGQLIDKLKISRSTLDKWVKLGLPIYRLGHVARFNLLEVLEWMKLNTKKEVKQ